MTSLVPVEGIIIPNNSRAPLTFPAQSARNMFRIVQTCSNRNPLQLQCQGLYFFLMLQMYLFLNIWGNHQPRHGGLRQALMFTPILG